MKIRKFLSESPVFALYQANSLVIEPMQSRLANYDVHLLQGLILTAFFFEDREVRPRELFSVFKVSKSNLSHALRSLERKGLVKRTTQAKDARGYWFSLTAVGRKKALLLVKDFDEIENLLEKTVGKKAINQFVNTTIRIRSVYQSNIKWSI